MRSRIGKKWQPVYEPPEQIQQCLHCEKPRCDNCYGETEEHRNQLKQWREAAERRKAERQAEKEKEWHEIEKMFMEGFSVGKICRILGKNINCLYKGKHAARYRAYRARQERSKKPNGNTDGNPESNRKNRGKEAW